MTQLPDERMFMPVSPLGCDSDIHPEILHPYAPSSGLMPPHPPALSTWLRAGRVQPPGPPQERHWGEGCRDVGVWFRGVSRA